MANPYEPSGQTTQAPADSTGGAMRGRERSFKVITGLSASVLGPLKGQVDSGNRPSAAALHRQFSLIDLGIGLRTFQRWVCRRRSQSRLRMLRKDAQMEFEGRMTFPQKFTLLCAQRRRTLRSVALSSGVAFNKLVSHVSGQKRTLLVHNAVRIARVFGVSVDWLFDDRQGWSTSTVESPPIAIYPWPPNGITWAEVQAAIGEYVSRRAALQLAALDDPNQQAKHPENIGDSHVTDDADSESPPDAAIADQTVATGTATRDADV